MTSREAIEFLKNMIDREAIGSVNPTGEGDVAIWQYHTEALQLAIKALTEQRWIPVKTRPMTEEEREYWSEHYGYDLEGDEAVMFDCPMPEDGQEVWVCFKSGYVAENEKMDDYISRQAAEQKRTEERTETHACDLISRQAAIDRIESHIRMAEEPYQLSETDRILNYAFEVSASCIYNLPSAPVRDVVLCQDCKWYKTNYMWNGTEVKICAIEAYEPRRNADDYCSYGERKNE